MAQFQNNRNNDPVTSPDWSIQALKSVTLNGTTGNGAVGTVNLFTVTGAVLMRLFAKVVTAPSAASASISPSSSISASTSPSASVSPSASPSPSTGGPYNLSFWMSTNYVSGDSNDGAFVVFKTRNSSGATVTSATTTKVKTTTGWTNYKSIITPGASSVVFDIQLSITGNTGAATLIMDAWFDDIFLFPVVRNLI